MLPPSVRQRIAAVSKSTPEVVAAMEEFLDAGEPLPYVARRHADRVGWLDTSVLRKIAARIEEARELELRRANVLKSLEPLGDAAAELRAHAEAAADRCSLDDVAAHLRKHKGTRGSEAIAKGLEPLADRLQSEEPINGPLDGIAEPFVNPEKGVATTHDALTGAAAILAERFAADPVVRERVRREMRERGEVVSKVFDASKPGAERYKEFFDLRERGKHLAGRRYSKLRQGEKERVLKFTVEFQADAVVKELAPKLVGAVPEGAPEGETARLELRRKALQDAVGHILPGAIELDVRTEWKERADLETIHTLLRKNIRALCHRPPFGRRVVVGVDTTPRKSLRAAVVGPDGSLRADATFELKGDARAASLERAAAWLREHAVEAVAVGSESTSNEAYKFFREAAEASPKAVKAPDSTEAQAGKSSEEAAPVPEFQAPEVIRVPEVGASSIANSPLGREELGDHPVPVRMAVSIARRLQDPIAEYARVEPKTLSGFHHSLDVSKGRLERLLTEEMESCVHEIPVDLNTAPAALLKWVGGMGIENAKKIVEWRRENGPFPSRVALARVGLDEAVYRRAVAFLRVHGGADPLDATGVHPDHAPVVEKICRSAGVESVKDLTSDMLRALAPEAVADSETPARLVEFVRDVLLESRQDPRGRFVVTVHNEGVRSVGHLKPGQELEGIVRGIAPFGVFVDLGVHQDGLLHVSELADHFVKDPHEVVKVGQHVKVRVLAIDPVKKKIALTMKSEEARRKAEEHRAAERAARQAAREAGATEGFDRRRRSGGGVRAGVREGGEAAAAPVRAASTRRDGLAGGRKPRHGGGADRGGPRKGRGRVGAEREEEPLTAESPPAKGDAAKPEPGTPPANPFKRFFEARGLIET